MEMNQSTVTFVTLVGSGFIYKRVGNSYDCYLGTPTKKGIFRKKFFERISTEEAYAQWDRLIKNGSQRL
jgi:hypothetical protein